MHDSSLSLKYSTEGIIKCGELCYQWTFAYIRDHCPEYLNNRLSIYSEKDFLCPQNFSPPSTVCPRHHEVSNKQGDFDFSAKIKLASTIRNRRYFFAKPIFVLNYKCIYNYSICTVIQCHTDSFIAYFFKLQADVTLAVSY